MKSLLTLVIAGVVFCVPLVSDAWTYGGYPYSGSWYGSQHVFAPYTYVNNAPYVNVSASAASYAYPSYPSYTYSYPQQMYGYSYPQYQTSYSQPGYYQPTYQPMYYQPNYYQQDYGYSSYPSRTSSYMSGGDYCYSGYGCYPFEVDDPHQWLHDPWTGSWY